MTAQRKLPTISGKLWLWHNDFIIDNSSSRPYPYHCLSFFPASQQLHRYSLKLSCSSGCRVSLYSSYSSEGLSSSSAWLIHGATYLLNGTIERWLQSHDLDQYQASQLLTFWGPNGQHLADRNFKLVFVRDTCCILIRITHAFLRLQ